MTDSKLINENEIKIKSKKNSFSNRSNTEEKRNIQIKEFDSVTRNAFNVKCWDLLNLYCEQVYDLDRNVYQTSYYERFSSFIGNYLGNNILNVSPNEMKDFSIVENLFNEIFQKGTYSDILDTLELIADSINIKGIDIYKEFDKLFIDNFVGYKFIGGKICPISNESEMTEIEKALDTDYQNVHLHIKKALNFLSYRKNPDYYNSIKESYTALEAFGNILGNDGIYTNFKNFIKKIYDEYNELFKPIEYFINFVNYVSGIRHANNHFNSEMEFNEAKFCLVLVSSIINYLTIFINK